MQQQLTLVFALLFTASLFAQHEPPQPFEEFGVKVKVLTLSNGKFSEFFPNDTVFHFGSVMFNHITGEVESVVLNDTLYGEYNLKPDVVSRWFSPDPLGAKFPNWSPYNFVLNNPMGNIDPDGQDVILLINAKAPFGTYMSGHSAVLVGDDSHGWVLYEKTGDNNGNGSANANIIPFKSLQEFQDNYGSAGTHEYGYRMKTSHEQDVQMLATSERDVHSPYDLDENNCADFCRKVISSGGLETGEKQTMLGITIPVLDFQEIASKNPNGENINLMPKGQTPEAMSKFMKENMKTPSEEQLKKNSFIFSQVVDDKGKVKVEAGTYKLDNNLNLKKQ
jgi:hypothetical protein